MKRKFLIMISVLSLISSDLFLAKGGAPKPSSSAKPPSSSGKPSRSAQMYKSIAESAAVKAISSRSARVYNSIAKSSAGKLASSMSSSAYHAPSSAVNFVAKNVMGKAQPVWKPQAFEVRTNQAKSFAFGKPTPQPVSKTPQELLLEGIRNKTVNAKKQLRELNLLEARLENTGKQARKLESLRENKSVDGKKTSKEPSKSSESSSSSVSDPRYIKYEKMRKMGVPEGSVGQKMSAEGFSPAEVSSFMKGGAPTISSSGPVSSPVSISSMLSSAAPLKKTGTPAEGKGAKSEAPAVAAESTNPLIAELQARQKSMAAKKSSEAGFSIPVGERSMSKGAKEVSYELSSRGSSTTSSASGASKRVKEVVSYEFNNPIKQLTARRNAQMTAEGGVKRGIELKVEREFKVELPKVKKQLEAGKDAQAYLKKHGKDKFDAMIKSNVKHAKESKLESAYKNKHEAITKAGEKAVARFESHVKRAQENKTSLGSKSKKSESDAAVVRQESLAKNKARNDAGIAIDKKTEAAFKQQEHVWEREYRLENPSWTSRGLDSAKVAILNKNKLAARNSQKNKDAVTKAGEYAVAKMRSEKTGTPIPVELFKAPSSQKNSNARRSKSVKSSKKLVRDAQFFDAAAKQGVFKKGAEPQPVVVSQGPSLQSNSMNQLAIIPGKGVRNIEQTTLNNREANRLSVSEGYSTRNKAANSIQAMFKNSRIRAANKNKAISESMSVYTNKNALSATPAHSQKATQKITHDLSGGKKTKQDLLTEYEGRAVPSKPSEARVLASAIVQLRHQVRVLSPRSVLSRRSGSGNNLFGIPGNGAGA